MPLDSVPICSPSASSSCASENPPCAASEIAAEGCASANTRRSSKLRRRALSGTTVAPARHAPKSATTSAGTLGGDHRDALAGALAQTRRQPIDGLVQLAVGELCVAVRQRRALWALRHSRLQ